MNTTWVLYAHEKQSRPNHQEMISSLAKHGMLVLVPKLESGETAYVYVVDTSGYITGAVGNRRSLDRAAERREKIRKWVGALHRARAKQGLPQSAESATTASHGPKEDDKKVAGKTAQAAKEG